jgi:predicted nucleotidyltransferase
MVSIAPLQYAQRRLALLVVDMCKAEPFSYLSESGYRALATSLARAFTLRFPGQIRSIYLRRSCATGAFVPGLSDIDLMVIPKNTVPIETRVRILDFFRATTKTVPLLDRHEEVFCESQFIYRYWHNPQFAFRVHEGRQSWVLLAGDDILSMLGPAAHSTLVDGILAEAQMYQYLAQSHEPIDLITDKFGIRRREYFTFKNAMLLYSLPHFVESAILCPDRMRTAAKLVTDNQFHSLWPQLVAFVKFHQRHYFRKSFCTSLDELRKMETVRANLESSILNRFRS